MGNHFGVVSRKKEESVRLTRAIDTLNLAPMRYQYAPEWANYVSNAERRMRQTLERTQPDDLNGDMFDAEIDAVAMIAKAHAAQQHTEHLDLLWAQVRRLNGDLSKKRSLREDLAASLAALEEEISRWKNKGRE